MTRQTLWQLLTVNMVLLSAVVLMSLLPAPAEAQFADSRPGDYLMIASATPGRSQFETVIITDLNNSMMFAIYYDVTRRQFTPAGFRNIANDSSVANSGG